ncbi:unnamed protein product, partial [Meganyctiphanes norvegica]
MHSKTCLVAARYDLGGFICGNALEWQCAAYEVYITFTVLDYVSCLCVYKNTNMTNGSAAADGLVNSCMSAKNYSFLFALGQCGIMQDICLSSIMSLLFIQFPSATTKYGRPSYHLLAQRGHPDSYGRILVATNVVCPPKEIPKSDKSSLLIGGDLLIEKTSEKKVNDIKYDKPIPLEIPNSITIEKIAFNCSVLKDHSAVCNCSTPRLHVYLTSSHRCNISCNQDISNQNINMSGIIKSKTKSRKSCIPQKMIRRKTLAKSLNKDLEMNHLKITQVESIREFNIASEDEDDGPKSELLLQDCSNLPSMLEYVIVNDESLNLKRNGHDVNISSGKFTSKIDNILDNMDGKSKPIASDSKTTFKVAKSTNKKMPMVQIPMSTTNSKVNQVYTDTNISSMTKDSPSTSQSSLDFAVTNHRPSLKDIFGDVDIKEEPADSVVDDMSIDDFKRELSKINKLPLLPDETTKSKAKNKHIAGELNESFSTGLFAQLIKEEVDDIEDSDNSLGPLQIDEGEPTPVPADSQTLDSSNINRTTELHMPSVNIISPYKIKIVLGSPKHEAGILRQDIKPVEDVANTLKIIKTAEMKKEKQVQKTVGENESEMSSSFNAKVIADIPQELKCKYCLTECKSFEELANHLDNHQKDGLIICYFCQKSFGDKTGMKRHMRTHTGEKPYQCKVCGKCFSLPGNFKKHRDIHEDRRTEPCEVCGKTFRRKEHLKYHMRTHTGEKPYKCTECGSSFTARYSLQIHMNIHLGKKPYKCTYCNKAFSDKSTMRKHVRVHTGEKPFHCEQCGRSFGESGTLAAHMATHSNDRPYKCEKCELTFKTTGGLRQHEKVHTGEKQFACKFCGMKFLQKYNMTMHERIHTGEKPYSCQECDRSFRSRSCLAKHVVLHGGDEERRYECEQCSSRFYRKAHLKRHIDMHNGVKNYQCKICSKKFCTRGTLKNHLKTFHSQGARKFPCNWCGRVFKRKIYVTTHECAKRKLDIKSEDINEKPESSNTQSLEYNDDDDDDDSINSDDSSIEVKSEPNDSDVPDDEFCEYDEDLEYEEEVEED